MIKKLLLMIVDACAARVLLPALDQGDLPNFRALAEAGRLHPECITVFPSLTPAATASIITGQYPCSHGVLGFHWYDTRTDEVVYYGDDFWLIWQKGFGDFFRDFLDKLNHQRLQAETLFQRVERAGLKAASLNYLIFRGDVKHTATTPFPVNYLSGVPFTQDVYGPSLMYFGDLVDTDLDTLTDPLAKQGGFFHRFGFDDANTATLLLQLAEQRALPEATVAYFPDNDFRSHDVGPEAALVALKQVDDTLGELIATLGGLEQMLADYCLVLTGDHSQTDMLAGEAAGIRLDDLLAGFSITTVGKPWNGDHQLLICPNMRSAQIYFGQLPLSQIEQVMAQLLADPRIDQVLWRAEDLNPDKTGYGVATADRGQLRFWPGRETSHSAIDQYGQAWSWRGELAALDGQISAANILSFPDYPNAFERIVGALSCNNSGHLWLTARPGYEFRLDETSIHLGGGSHGSLHALDSISPLLVAGGPPDLELPAQLRAVDVSPLCLSLLGLRSERVIGESHLLSGEVK